MISKGESQLVRVSSAVTGAKGRRATQSPPVSATSFVNVSLSILFILSTCPELWGLEAQCSFHLAPKARSYPHNT